MDDVKDILVIEDDPRAAGLLEKILTPLGYKVWVADHPKRGLELAETTMLAAAITELRFAGMNGVEVAKAMGKVSPQTSVVVMTPAAFLSAAIEAMEAGAYGYVTKPLNPTEVRIVMQRAVERFSLLASQTEKRQFAELSVKDGLTGVYNRRYFKLCLSQKLSLIKSNTERLSLLMLDLDDFKHYNDTKGHLAGDEVLRSLCKVLKDAMRQGDLVFRYGGEEFLVLLDKTDKTGASLVAERLRTLITLYTPLTASMGVSTFPEDGGDEQALLAKADAALYDAKRSGKNRVCLASLVRMD